MCVYIHTYTCTFIHMWMYVCVYVHMYVCMCIYVCMGICVYADISMNIRDMCFVYSFVILALNQHSISSEWTSL